MAKKYELVASFYEKGRFKEEIVLEGAPTTLHEIDYLTCIYPNMHYFLNLLDRDGIISGKNHLSIRFVKDKEYHYIQPLFGYPELQQIIPYLRQKEAYRDGKKHYFLAIPNEHPLYKEKLRELYEWINISPELFFDNIYGKNYPKKLNRFVSLYLEDKDTTFTHAEDERAFLDNKSLLELEFSRYKTFRGYLIRTTQYKQDNQEIVSLLDQKLQPSALEETEPESPFSHDSSDDEFLEPEEIENAVGEGEVWYRVK